MVIHFGIDKFGTMSCKDRPHTDWGIEMLARYQTNMKNVIRKHVRGEELGPGSHVPPYETDIKIMFAARNNSQLPTIAIHAFPAKPLFYQEVGSREA